MTASIHRRKFLQNGAKATLGLALFLFPVSGGAPLSTS